MRKGGGRERVLQILTEAARRGERCPTNRRIMELCETLTTLASVGRAVKDLEASGHIKIGRDGTLFNRTVTIVATGESTDIGVPPHEVEEFYCPEEWPCNYDTCVVYSHMR